MEQFNHSRIFPAAILPLNWTEAIRVFLSLESRQKATEEDSIQFCKIWGKGDVHAERALQSP